MSRLKIMCTGEIEVDFHDLLDLQLTESGKSLKSTSQEKIDKLAKSLKEYGIVNNLQIWTDGDKIYCFDAHHRKKAFIKLEKEGLEIPLLPATRCLAKTIKEAKRLLILKESSHSWINDDVVKDYLSEINFDIDEAKSLIEIPDFDWPDEYTTSKEDTDKALEKFSDKTEQGIDQRSDSTDEKIKIMIWIPEKIKKETIENLNRRGLKYEIV